ncbi:hypothetical protein ACFL0U_01075 [Pseudomonadota bacterium]
MQEIIEREYLVRHVVQGQLSKLGEKEVRFKKQKRRILASKKYHKYLLLLQRKKLPKTAFVNISGETIGYSVRFPSLFFTDRSGTEVSPTFIFQNELGKVIGYGVKFPESGEFFIADKYGRSIIPTIISHDELGRVTGYIIKLPESDEFLFVVDEHNIVRIAPTIIFRDKLGQVAGYAIQHPSSGELLFTDKHGVVETTPHITFLNGRREVIGYGIKFPDSDGFFFADGHGTEIPSTVLRNEKGEVQGYVLQNGDIPFLDRQGCPMESIFTFNTNEGDTIHVFKDLSGGMFFADIERGYARIPDAIFKNGREEIMGCAFYNEETSEYEFLAVTTHLHPIKGKETVIHQKREGVEGRLSEGILSHRFSSFYTECLSSSKPSVEIGRIIPNPISGHFR